MGRPFLRNLFPLLHDSRSRNRFYKIRLPAHAKRDLKWWALFLQHWCTVSLICPSPPDYYVSTDASGRKGIGGFFAGHIFANRVPARHRDKHIDWKEMFAVLHAFFLWHENWKGGRVLLACDNTTVVAGINKRSIAGPAILLLQRLLLIAALFDIDVLAFWIPSELNAVASAASRHDYSRLANLGFQEQAAALRNRSRIPTAMGSRRLLSTFFNMQSPQQPAAITLAPNAPSSSFAVSDELIPSRPPSTQSSIG